MDAPYKKEEIGVCGVQIYEGLFYSWHISNWSFGLDVRLHPNS